MIKIKKKLHKNNIYIHIKMKEKQYHYVKKYDSLKNIHKFIVLELFQKKKKNRKKNSTLYCLTEEAVQPIYTVQAIHFLARLGLRVDCRKRMSPMNHLSFQINLC